MMTKKSTVKKVEDDPRYHDTWQLLKKYRDVVWSLELSVQQLKKQFELEYLGSEDCTRIFIMDSALFPGWLDARQTALQSIKDL